MHRAAPGRRRRRARSAASSSACALAGDAEPRSSRARVARGRRRARPGAGRDRHRTPDLLARIGGCGCATTAIAGQAAACARSRSSSSNPGESAGMRRPGVVPLAAAHPPAGSGSRAPASRAGGDHPTGAVREGVPLELSERTAGRRAPAVAALQEAYQPSATVGPRTFSPLRICVVTS